MMNARSLKLLRDFIQAPSYTTVSTLIHIPSLYNVIQYELQKQSTIPLRIINISKWLWIRGETVYRQLMVHHTAESNSCFESDDINWQQVCLVYHSVVSPF